MKLFRERRGRIGTAVAAVAAMGLCMGAARPLWHGTAMLMTPGHGFAHWIEDVQAGSDVEKALYRLMQLPHGEILFRRPPSETVPALAALSESQKNAALYSMRALEEEQELKFAEAERDWKTWAEKADDPTAAHLDLADFYERRLKPQDELAALELVGKAGARPQERWTVVESQLSWSAWQRALKVVDQYALAHTTTAHLYSEWMARYPKEASLYARAFSFLLEEKDFAAASELINRYRGVFPDDRVFPVKAEADMAARRGSAKDGLAIYEARFEPLWPAELVKSYFDLVLKSQGPRQFSDTMRAKLAANSDDLKDAARLFYLYQQQGQLDSAKAVLSRYREQKDERAAKWSEEELDTLQRLFEAIQDFPEAARYAYALASDRSTAGTERKGLVDLARILLTAPEQPLRVGAGNLALYRNIGTMDSGPGYLNGILSLFLNTQGPGSEYATEDQLAVPYFHRAKAAELIADIDKRFANEAERADLHARLMEAYGAYGENDAAIREGTALLAAFPAYEQRVKVALEVADAYTRTQQVEKEFAIYRDLLRELAAKADGMPLGSTDDAGGKPVVEERSAETANEPVGESVVVTANPAVPAVRSALYNEVLNRYLARMVSLHKLPDALNVLRGELDRNPQDPGLYQKLADFLEQNALNAREEEVYQKAIEQFQDTGWYAKLARLYLRQKRSADYSALMRKVAGIFSGTELEEFLDRAPAPDKSLALEVNLYAHQRFPHDLRFVNSLIVEYTGARRSSEVEGLLWAHWSESPQLRDRLFEVLSKSGELDKVLDQLRQQAPEIEKADWTGLAARNPAAERLWVDACLWQSQFEQGVGGAEALAAAYPADAGLNEQASSLYRSFAYFHPEDTDKSIAIEKRLLEAQPGNIATLARIGDIFADRARFAEARPYWTRMAEVHPGETEGYLQSATVFWDYFDFSSARNQLQRGRDRLGELTLFGYQAGAIEESRGNLAEAVREYTASAVAAKLSPESRERLLVLARKPAMRAQVEEGTAGLLKQSAPTAGAIQLRAGILEAEQRKDDLGRELKETVAQTTSFDVLDALTEAARSHELPEVEEAVMQRQIALTTDPVRNLQLRYQFVDLLQRRSAQAATQELDAIYHEHGKVLGVVRSTVDYDWGHERKQEAVAVLLESAKASYPELKSRFELETARKLTELGEYARSRALITELLGQKALDAGYEAAMADNLARANDQAGLEVFYQAQLELMRKAPLERGEKLQRIGQLRRGMIVAATRLGRTNEATDQYIELINAYPDDAGLDQEAALYAVTHGARDRLFSFCQKAIADSPRDPRWSIVLARVATSAEDYPTAIDAYSKAIHLRPERQDLYIAQATLEERLHKFDDAIGLYRKLYTLSYRDPKWMEKVAELSARQGHGPEAVKALETAWIEGHPVKATNSFTLASRLEGWGLLVEARKYAELGVEQAGADLLIDGDNQRGAATYARILARLRQTATAYARLTDARQQAAKVTLASVVHQVAKDGPGAVTDEEWRKQREKERTAQAKQGFAQAVIAMGQAAGQFHTPEEKTQFATWIKGACATASVAEISAVYLPAVKAAGLADLDAELTWSSIERSSQARNAELSSWIAFETQRGQVDVAAARLEKLAPGLPSKQRSAIWKYALDAYHKAGDYPAELRMAAHLADDAQLSGIELARYHQLLLAQQPQELIRLAGNDDAAAQYLVRNGNGEQALVAVDARAAGKASIWKNAYRALTGFYLRENQPEIGAAFATALGTDASIGDRVAHAADRDQQLAGAVWFYYGSRYGEFLDEEKDSRAEDYLESELERAPQSHEPYLHLADYSAMVDRSDAALSDYQRSLDLKRDQPAVQNKIAKIHWQQGRHSDALSAWSEAVKLVAAEIDARHVPETMWGDFAQVLANAGARGQYDSIRVQVDALLRTYIGRNGEYRSEPLLEAGYHANNDSIDWLLAATSAARNQEGVLESLLPNSWSTQGNWIRKDQISGIRRRIVELEERKERPNVNTGYDTLASARQKLVESLIDEKKFAEARVVLSQVSEEKRTTAAWLPDLLAVADADGTLDQLLSQWKKQDHAAPAANDLRNATGRLSEKGSHAVRRFIYEQALAKRELTAPNFLGLAAIYLDAGDDQGAVRLLKRMTLVSEDAYADADSAAQLLEERHKNAEALQFLRPLAEASPWNAGIRVRLASTMLAVHPQQTEALSILDVAVADPKALYSERVAAALALKGHGASSAGSDELKILASSNCPTLEEVSKPLFVETRLAAASCAANAKTKEHVLRDGLAISPWNVEVRRQYIWSAFAAGFDFRALVAAEPFLQSASAYSANDVYPAAESREAGLDDAVVDDGDGTQSPQNLSLSSLKPDEAAKLLDLVIGADEHHHDLVAASRLLPIAILRSQDRTHRQSLVDKQKHIDLEIAREHENDARTPIVHAELDQGRVVRPRLKPGEPFEVRKAVSQEEQP